MPYKVSRTIGGFEVVNTATGQVHAKHTTREKAERQVRLLHMVENGRKATGKPPRR